MRESREERRASCQLGVRNSANRSLSGAKLSDMRGFRKNLVGSWCVRLIQWLAQFKSKIIQKRVRAELRGPEKAITESRYNQTDDVDDDDDDESGFEDDDSQDERSATPEVREWNIPSTDLKFDVPLVRGPNRAIYKGKWHGDVLIHTFTPSHEGQKKLFLRQIKSLAMIRHENVALFMGACVEPSLLAIVTSARTGPSVFDYVRLHPDKSLFSDKIHIAHQVAQAMGYLHAKGMVHGRLSSRNVFLEGRVQVSLLDHDLPQSSHGSRSNVCCVPRGHLTYLSPELMCSLILKPPHITTAVPHTQQSDIYAFGTLLFEMVTRRCPLQGEDSHSIIWRICSGRGESVENLKTPSTIKELVAMCWSFESVYRPTFPQIIRHLERSVALHRRYSSSEPERLNRLDQKLVC